MHCEARIGKEQRKLTQDLRSGRHGTISFCLLGLSPFFLRREMLCALFHLSYNWCKASCDCTPTVECRLTFPSYFGSPFSSWLSLPNCSHHGGRFQRSPPEGQGADGVWCSPSGTSNGHSRLSRVSVRFQNKQLDKEMPWPSYNF